VNKQQSLMLLMISSFLLAYCLAIIPLPESLRDFRPNFVALLLLYWLLRAPEWFGVGSAWLLGLILDGLTGVYLGQHAMSFAVLAYIVLVLYQRLRMFSIGQQALLVFVLLGLDLMLNSWVDMVLRGGKENLMLLSGAVLGAMLWPVMASYLARWQMKFL